MSLVTPTQGVRSAGRAFRAVIAAAGQGNVRKPAQLLGAVTPYCAMLAEKAGAKALYLSGSGVATSSFGLPDLGITTADNVVEDVKRLTGASSLPLLVDIDTGFGSAFNIARTNKQIVSKEEMVDRIKAAVSGRTDPEFVIMARTDALASEGLESAIARAKAYIDAGADMLFPEACTKLEDYRAFQSALSLPNYHKDVPILANITEFGQTPLYTVEELGSAGVSMVLYPLSAFRAMSKAALTVYEAIIKEGTQKSVVPLMQTRAELYGVLKYHTYEDQLDKLFEQQKKK